MELCNVQINQTVKIISINCESSLAQRLGDLGLVRGTCISPVLVSPLGDPVAYEFRGNIIAIRSHDSQNIIVEL